MPEMIRGSPCGVRMDTAWGPLPSPVLILVITVRCSPKNIESFSVHGSCGKYIESSNTDQLPEPAAEHGESSCFIDLTLNIPHTLLSYGISTLMNLGAQVLKNPNTFLKARRFNPRIKLYRSLFHWFVFYTCSDFSFGHQCLESSACWFCSTAIEAGLGGCSFYRYAV